MIVPENSHMPTTKTETTITTPGTILGTPPARTGGPGTSSTSS
jgi:hypothetical protein